MPSLRQLQSHAPLLLIDAASSRVQAGLLDAHGRWRWETSEAEAGIAIFAGIEKLPVNIGEVASFAFCDGPGSVLGIRSVAMALRAWNVLRPRPMFAYSSLAVVAHALGRDDIAVIADARREAWHHYRIGAGLRRLPAESLRDGVGELLTPDGFRHWAPLPADTRRTSYDLANLLPRVSDADLFLPTDAPDAFLHEEPSYVTWTPQIHRAPGEK